MFKRDETTLPDSCLNRADDDEMLFVLLARDKAAPNTIRFWIKERIRLGLNATGSPKMAQAEACAQRMEEEYATRQGK